MSHQLCPELFGDLQPLHFFSKPKLSSVLFIIQTKTRPIWIKHYILQSFCSFTNLFRPLNVWELSHCTCTPAGRTDSRLRSAKLEKGDAKVWFSHAYAQAHAHAHAHAPILFAIHLICTFIMPFVYNFRTSWCVGLSPECFQDIYFK